jgi:cytochrome c oxidase assembly factor CtaG/cytochrome c2
MPVLTVLIAAALVAGSGPAALAHEAAAPARDLDWTWNPWILASLGLASAWYAAGLLRMSRRDGAARVIAPRQAIGFAAGMAILFAALVSPVHEMSEQLLSAHMVQHLLLMFAAPPLLVYGRPVIAFLWAFPPGGRKRVGRWWSGLGLGRLFEALMHPFLVWVLYCGSFVTWHLPRLYEWALRDENVHTAEHLCFFVTSLMFWSLVIEFSERRRLGYGATLLLIVHTAILSGLPGALIALAPRPIYPAYAGGVAAWGMTLMQDQQLAGVIMWIPAGLAYLAAAAFVFVRWLEDADRHTPRSLRRAAPVAVIAILPVLLLAGCGRQNTQPKVVESGGGDSQRGAALIRANGCGGCHTIPGIEDATGLVGPPLDHMRNRVYIAGLLRNTPANMQRWLQNPQAVVPGNVMPDMQLSARDARDLTAFLYTLR